MQLSYAGHDVEVFSLVPRSHDAATYWSSISAVTELSDRYGYTGMLIFTGNDVLVEPWIVAQMMILRSASLIPLVAVNPVYMHPFTAARMISSLAYAYQRRVFLNLITGTALNYLQALRDSLSHDERYDRLLEYTKIVKLLLQGRPVSYEGRFYQVNRLQLLPSVPQALSPGYVLAGQSAAARRVSAELGAKSLQVLAPELEAGIGCATAINLGIVTRATEEQAWSAARRNFPEDTVGQIMLNRSMKNTDSEWKQRMMIVAEQGKNARGGFWMDPFKNFQADQPYFVGSHDRVGRLVADLVRGGVRMFVLDVPPTEEEYDNVATALRYAAEHVQ
jgi:alkanesulfonate monooxygenase